MDQAEKPKWKELLGQRGVQDFIVILLIAVAAYLISSSIDGFELLVEYVHSHEEWELDEYITVGFILIFASVIFSFRRWREKYHELQKRQQAEKELRKTLADKDMLIKETHHRIKNNLFIIENLIYLQKMDIKDPKALKSISQLKERIHSIALIHDKLYQGTNLETINFRDYGKELINDIFYSLSKSPTFFNLEIDIDDVFLKVDQSIPLGLIINELITNSLKYAFAEEEEEEEEVGAHIYVGLKENGNGRCLLTVKDNGIGFPTGIDYKKSKSLGLKLVNGLTRQINGSLEMDNSEGTTFKLSFPK